MTHPNDGQYQVVPEETHPLGSEATKFDWGTVGCLVPLTLLGTIFVVGLCGVLTGATEVMTPTGTTFHSASEMYAWLPPILTSWGVLFILGTLWAYLSYARESEEKKAARWRKTLDGLEAEKTKKKEAMELEQRAAGAFTSSAQLAMNGHAMLEAARGWLQKAEAEFQERAFGPFWDAIEKAACNLEEFRKGAATINEDANTYYKALEGRRHTFPSFGLVSDVIPDPTPVLENLRRLVRKGQTDFHFANIWEHRRTREVLIAGFRTLEDGISNLGYAVCSAISDLQSTLSSSLAEIVEQQISLRETVEAQGEEQTRMLDDIRRGKKPPW